MKLSVIVCTHNRAHTISECLESIAAALSNAPPTEAEIVVVDNASTDDTSTRVKAFADSCSFPVVLLHEPRKGLSVARNCGLRGSRGELIAFTDDDCRPHSDYVKDLLRHFNSDTAPVLRGGRVELGDSRDFRMTIKTDNEAADYAHPTHPAGFIHGANMTMSRTVVERLGMFDERFGAGTAFPGEDCDYIIRAAAAGIRVQYVPDMIIYHFHGRRDRLSAQKLFAGYMRANGALYIKHFHSSPLLIRHLWWDIRHWFKEVRYGEEKFLSEADIGHRQIIIGNIIGMIQFSALLAQTHIARALCLRKKHA